MRRFAFLTLATAVVACSSNPDAPSATTQTATGLFGAVGNPYAATGGDGIASTTAVTTERIRLRRVGGPDIMTTLVSGQVIDVPVNVNLDIWAEIRRLETDQARLLVDWGNGNSDFTGCGACRLENKYTEEGRYTVTAKVVDLNAPSGTAPILSVTVTLNVREHLSCAAVGTDFSSVATGVMPNFGVPGATFSSGPQSDVRNLAALYPPLFAGNAYVNDGKMTITFDTDKNFISIDVITTTAPAPQLPVTFQAFDGSGNPTFGGSLVATTPTTSSFHEGTIRGEGIFRRIEFTSPYAWNFIAFDNLNASCQ